MTTKQSARLHRKSVNRDCFVVLHTLHHLSTLLAMTRSGLFQQSPHAGQRDAVNLPWQTDGTLWILQAEPQTNYSFFSNWSDSSCIFLMNGVSRSIGTGKMSVEFFSAATSVSVCRKRNCSV